MLECQACGMPVTEDLAQLHGSPLCRKCAARVRPAGAAGVASVTPARASGNYYLSPTSSSAAMSLAGPIIGGIIGGVIGGVIWYAITVWSGWRVGYLAIGVGWLVGYGTLKGAKNETGEIPLMLTSGIIALLSMLFSEYCIIRYLVLDYISTTYGPASLEKVNPQLLSQVCFSIMGHQLWTLIFWAIAIYIAVKTVRS